MLPHHFCAVTQAQQKGCSWLSYNDRGLVQGATSLSGCTTPAPCLPPCKHGTPPSVAELCSSADFSSFPGDGGLGDFPPPSTARELEQGRNKQGYSENRHTESFQDTKNRCPGSCGLNREVPNYRTSQRAWQLGGKRGMGCPCGFEDWMPSDVVAGGVNTSLYV